MNNTLKRILSALVIISIVIGCMIMGPRWLLFFIFLIGILMVDELYLNFLKKGRERKGYLLAQGLFCSLFVFFNFVGFNLFVFQFSIYLCLIINILLTIFLFRYIGSPEKKFIKFLQTYSIWIGGYILIFLMAMAYPIHRTDWMKWIFLILLVNFSADSFAWFFGKNFGKTKLMPRVSPKKTREGAIGGVVSSTVLGTIYWSVYISNPSLGVILSLGLIAVFSVVGDLVQSKLKRLFKIKDSSALIPGHGGVYDRLDSLIFVMPIYIILLVPKG